MILHQQRLGDVEEAEEEKDIEAYEDYGQNEGEDFDELKEWREAEDLTRENEDINQEYSNVTET